MSNKCDNCKNNLDELLNKYNKKYIYLLKLYSNTSKKDKTT